jgi:DNA helicase HerA-like ATPase
MNRHGLMTLSQQDGVHLRATVSEFGPVLLSRILDLNDIQDRPKLFSTFMLSLLAEVYSQMPEKGDADKPVLVIFIDEAHLIFDQASKALLDQIETIVKLIRSKSIGIFFVTQNPMDVPYEVLAQLGLKVQHALRAFTAVDRKAIKLTAENFPLSDFYKTDEALTALGIGEALVTALNEKGIPTPLAATMMRAPMSRMDILTPDEIALINRSSDLVRKYSQIIDRESAYEILGRKVEAIEKGKADEASRKEWEKQRSDEWERGRVGERARRTTTTRSRRISVSPVVKVLTSATFIRGMMGILKKVM